MCAQYCVFLHKTHPKTMVKTPDGISHFEVSRSYQVQIYFTSPLFLFHLSSFFAIFALSKKKFHKKWLQT
jgi:hypothetical protein